MIREADLVSYLPPFMAEYREIGATLEAENPEFVLAWKAAGRVLQNEFIETADEYGIARFEKILHILPSTEDTLESRRARVQNRWFNAAPYTLRMLALKLTGLLGGDHNFLLESHFREAYELVLTVYSTDDSRTEEIKNLLSVTVPANVIMNIIYESPHKGFVYYGTMMSGADIIEIKQRKV